MKSENKLNEQRKNGTDDSTEKRIQKLRFSISLLVGLIVGNLLAVFLIELLKLL